VKLVSFEVNGREHYGIVKGDRVIDLTMRISEQFPTMRSFIASGSLTRTQLLFDTEPGELAYADLKLLPVVPGPVKVICVGLNYQDHIAESTPVVGELTTSAKYPTIFMRLADSLAGHRQTLIRPHVSVQFDYEAELMVVIGKETGRYVSEADAMSHVFGYTCMNEGSIRDYQFFGTQFTAGKNFEQTGGTGPWIVTADEIADPMNLNIALTLNGETMQNSNTRNMIFSIPKIISYITQWVALKPGDLIATGTPDGVGLARKPQVWMKAGDVAEVTIEGIGTLSNTIADES
jgi:2-keto-4-pentenoate hydratase/2-oxohepta-3-ene-1,7-dioic acid hydratase in catechol pathway